TCPCPDRPVFPAGRAPARRPQSQPSVSPMGAEGMAVASHLEYHEYGNGHHLPRTAMAENVVIFGSSPAAWTAAISAAGATLSRLVYQGNPYDDKNRQNGTLPLGQLALTTEVENFPSWPAGDTKQYLRTALKPDDPDFPYWVAKDKEQPTHGING